MIYFVGLYVIVGIFFYTLYTGISRLFKAFGNDKRTRESTKKAKFGTPFGTPYRVPSAEESTKEAKYESRRKRV